MLRQIEEDKGDPEAAAENSFYSFYFGANPYGHPIEGDARGLATITPGDLKAFARGHWVRGGLKIALVGDVDAAAAASLLKFGLRQRCRRGAPPPPPAPVHLGAPGLHIVAMDVPQPTALFALPGLLRERSGFSDRLCRQLPSWAAADFLRG